MSEADRHISILEKAGIALQDFLLRSHRVAVEPSIVKIPNKYHALMFAADPSANLSTILNDAAQAIPKFGTQTPDSGIHLEQVAIDADHDGKPVVILMTGVFGVEHLAYHLAMA